MRIRFVSLLLLSICAFAAPALAQDQRSGTGPTADGSFTLPQNLFADQAKPPQQKPAPKPPKPKVPRPPVGARLFFAAESTTMAAPDTFKAITGSSSVVGFGGGGEILNLWRRLFLRVGVTSGSTSGERAFRVDGEVISTGVPIDIRLRTFELSLGWRKYLVSKPKTPPKTPPPPAGRPATPAKPRDGRFAVYFGLGLVAINLAEESDFAQSGDNDSGNFKGFTVYGGLEATLLKHIVAGLEVQYRSVADAIGNSGLSQSFGEDNLGGVAVRGLIGIRFRK